MIGFLVHSCVEYRQPDGKVDVSVSDFAARYPARTMLLHRVNNILESYVQILL